MTQAPDSGDVPTSRPYYSAAQAGRTQPATLADILERVLDKGIIIAGDIRVNLLDIELLTIKLRLLVVSVDKAEEMGIDWWRHDPMLTVKERGLDEENKELRRRVAELEGRDPDEDDEDTEDTGDTEGAAKASRSRQSSGARGGRRSS